MRLEPIGSNQTQIRTDKWVVLFSYKTPVAAQNLENGQTLVTSKKWSRTTSKHINKWLDGMTAKLVDQSELDSIGGDIK